MKKILYLSCLFFINGCMQPLYEYDYPLYRQYKYWESADDDWQEIDYFQIQAFRTQHENLTFLRLVPQRKGLPSTADGYIQAAQKAGFNIMNTVCNGSSPSIVPAKAPNQGRAIDRFFYQYSDASIGVTFFCHTKKQNGMDLTAEQQKWSLAERRWDSINGHKAFVDVLPPTTNGRQQIKLRLFGGTLSDNKRLARRIIQDTCPNSKFKILSDKAGVDIVQKGRMADVVSDENVRIYDFTCVP